MFSFFILTIQTSLVPLPAGLGRHAATPAQHHHKLPATFPGHFPITKLKPHLFLDTTLTPFLTATTSTTTHPHNLNRALSHKNGPVKTKS